MNSLSHEPQDPYGILLGGPQPAPRRAAALAALDRFLPRLPDYAARRNHDTSDAPSVSVLSAAVRRRLISEAELVRAALGQGSPEPPVRFIQEVLWRTYWKGWLAHHPSVWDRWCLEVHRLSTSGLDGSTATTLEQARLGRTGIDGFDHWTRELTASGHLHNHARMWFASIWTFTLRLPWELGAAFFWEHLLDGDPASNTLSWRWVAGLHTRGKAYLARAANIAFHTGGRFHPDGPRLAQDTFAIPDSCAPPPPSTPAPLPPSPPPSLPAPWALWILEDDLSPETTGLPAGRWAGILSALPATAFTTPPRSPRVQAWTRAAIDDARFRAASAFNVPSASVDGSGDAPAVAGRLVDQARQLGARALVWFDPPVGPWTAIAAAVNAAARCASPPLATCQLRREWDSRLWPLATAGYFRFWSAAAPLVMDPPEAAAPPPPPRSPPDPPTGSDAPAA